mmetsp:Transcript_6775/g.21868  ORF Transcript_6775/g.21868 Transcript_6775/m.21868 type:complete len:132 (-) Transcript_6775:27-422(-)
MTIYSLNVINRDGGLVYHRSFVETQPVDLRLASSFHVMHAMAASIAPVPNSTGIAELLCTSFKLVCFETRTGIKFYVIASPSHTASNIQAAFAQVYEAYADFVLKNPFYALEQPIRCHKFDIAVKRIYANA